MTDKHAERIQRYLDAWDRKDAAGIAACLDPNVSFKGPLAQLSGREAFMAAAARMFPLLERVKMRHLFVEGGTALAVYDFVCHAPIGNIRTCELVTFGDTLIRSSEIFFDTSPLTAQRSAT